MNYKNMKTEEGKIYQVEIKDLKVLENSRLRTEDDLSELMKSVKEVGILQPIVVRKSDMSVIMGNRRLSACKKLGLKVVPCILRNNLKDDTEIYIMNLTENIQRKDISSVEIGRYCYGLKTGKLSGVKLSVGEISIRLGIAESRVKTCIQIYSKVPKKYQKDIKLFQNSALRKYGDIPESTIKSIIRITSNVKKLTDKEFDTLIQAVRDKKLQAYELDALGRMLSMGYSVEKSLKLLDDYFLKSYKVLFHKKTLGKHMQRTRTTSGQDFIRHLIKKTDKELVL